MQQIRNLLMIVTSFYQTLQLERQFIEEQC
jgi:hypothetical protein